MAVLEARVRELEAKLAERDAKLAELNAKLAEQAAQLAKLQKELARLTGRLTRNSSNSSLPPSTDRGRNAKRNAKKGTKTGKAGAKKGHRGHHRALLPAERVDDTLEFWPCECGACGKALGRTPEGEPERRQHIEIPPVRAVVLEGRAYSVRCSCGTVTKAAFSETFGPRPFGTKLVATLAVLVGVFRLSRRQVQNFARTFFGVELALGTVSKLEQEASDALAPVYTEALAAARASTAAFVDETSWQMKHRTHWLWVMVTGTASVFMIHARRNMDAAKTLLAGFAGNLVTDRCPSYLFVSNRRRQLCWAHLLRLFESWTEAREGTYQHDFGKRLVADTRELFRHWHLFKDGALDRPALDLRTRALRRRMLATLREVQSCMQLDIQGKAANILRYQRALFTFLRVDDVEPTNNAAERALRHGVLHRKLSLGTQSERGARFLERMYTAAETLRRRGEHLLPFLIAAVDAHRRGRPAPSILPDR